MRGRHCVKTWGKAQPMVTLSSAEAALVAGVKAGPEGRGGRHLLADSGRTTKVDLIVDASAAIGMIEKRGMGCVKHIDTKWMWLPGAIRRGDITIFKIDTNAIFGRYNDNMSECLFSQN